MSAYVTGTTLATDLAEVLERSTVSLTIADFEAEDCPLVGVNSAFCDLSGYGPDEILNRNCRFLQPPGGAGPVRDRVRAYLQDPDVADARFVIPNVTKDGKPFLNLVYVTKLLYRERVVAVLGSQFAVADSKRGRMTLYDRALRADLRQIKDIVRQEDVMLLGSYDAIANGQAIVAQSRLDDLGDG